MIQILIANNFQSFEFRPFAFLGGGFWFNKGQEVDYSNHRLADSQRGGIYFNTNIGKHFSGSVNHRYRNLSLNAGNIFTANQTDIRLSYQFNIRQRLRLAVIQTDINRGLSLYNEPEEKNRKKQGHTSKSITSYKSIRKLPQKYYCFFLKIQFLHGVLYDCCKKSADLH